MKKVVEDDGDGGKCEVVDEAGQDGTDGDTGPSIRPPPAFSVSMATIRNSP